MDLVNDLLDVQKLESGNMPLQFQPLDLVTIIDNAVAPGRALEERFEVRFRVEQTEGSSGRASVYNQGKPIPPALQSQIFTKFFQVDSSSQRKQQGSGLGLSISKGIVERHDGRIGFTSSEEGTCFFFELPLSH